MNSDDPNQDPTELSRQQLLDEVQRLRQELATLRQGADSHAEESSLLPPGFHRQVLEGLPAQIAVFDSRHRYLYVNPASISDPERRRWLLGRTDLEYCERYGRDPAIAHQRNLWRQRCLDEGRSVGFEEEITTVEGEKRIFLRLHSPLLGEDGQVEMVIGYSMEVTDHKTLEHRLQQMQKLEAVGQLAGGLAHDFNNLLTSILGYSQILGEQLEEGSRSQNCAREITRAGQRAARLVGQLLAFSRQQMLQVRHLDLNPTIQGLEGVLRSSLGENIELRLDLAPYPMMVRVDPQQLEQVLLNLAVNSRDAMPEGGSFTLRTRTVDEPTDVEGSVLKGRFHCLTVLDTGLGMDSATRAQIFEPFFTTKETGQGTGLGLSTVYGIVQQSKGQIAVKSRLGEGTQFEIYLPTVSAALLSTTSPPERPREESQPLTRGSGETILVAEDEGGVRQLVHDMLEALGYRVLVATDGLKALHIASVHRGPIHLLLTDVVMPRMGGIELAQTLHQESPETRILFMSGYTRDAAERHGLSADDIHFLAKPFRPQELGRKVRQVLDSPQARLPNRRD